MADILRFNGVTKLDANPDFILEQAQGELEGVVIMGYTKDGDEYFVSSYADGGTANFLADRLKAKLIRIVDELSDPDY